MRSMKEKMKRKRKIPETLAELRKGEVAVVKEVRAEGAIKHRLVDMGIIPGTKVCVRKVAPLGDPIQISLRGYELLIRGSDAREILIGPENGGIAHGA